MIVDATGASIASCAPRRTASLLPAPTAAAPVSTARGIVRTGGGAPDASAAPPGEN